MSAPAENLNLFAVRSDRISFLQRIEASAANSELVREFDRLRGTNLRGSPVDLAVDKATGRLASDLQSFIEFVLDCVFLRVSLRQAEVPEKMASATGLSPVKVRPEKPIA
jgi:hypothetical protein